MPWHNQLLAAVQYRSPETAKQLLLYKVEHPDGPFKTYITPLQIAVLNNDLSSVKALIRHGANVNLQNEAGEAALHIAVHESSSIEIFGELLKAGANQNTMDDTKQTPLHIACLLADHDKVKAILKQQNPPVNHVDEEGATPMHLLVFAYSDYYGGKISEMFGIIQLAIAKSFNVNAQTVAGETLLHVANHGVNSERILQKLLMIDGLDVSLQDELGDNFLHGFLQHRPGVDTSETFLTSLLTEEFSPLTKSQITTILNQKNHAGHLPLSAYITKGIVSPKFVRTLISFIQDIEVRGNLGQSLVHLITQSPAMQDETVRVIKQLVKRGANVTARDIFGRTPIFFARHFNVVQILIENGADVNAQDQCRRTPLMATLPACNSRICQYLINKRCNINASDKFGQTALHYAAFVNRVRELEVLIRSGANVYHKDKAGRTAWDVASYWRCRDAVDLLDTAMSEPQPKRAKMKQSMPHIRQNVDQNLWVHIHRFEVSATEFQNISNLRKYLGFHLDTEEYFERIMQFPGVGLPKAVEEASFIESLVLTVIETIASGIGDLDKRFQCSVFRSGSTSEGTKIDDPDEFDFLFILERFSEMCGVDKHVDMAFHKVGFECVKHVRETMQENFKRYVDADRSLLCGRIREDFFVLVKRVLTSKSTWILDEVFIEEFSIINIKQKPIINFNLFVNAELYKGIHVSVDVVPALRKKDWCPVGARTPGTNEMVPDLVFKEDFLLLCQQPQDTNEDKWVDTGTNFRLSCAPLEIKLMLSLPEWVRQSYAIAKIMKSNFMCPTIKFTNSTTDENVANFDTKPDIMADRNGSVTASDEISSYMLKNCLFHVVSAEPIILKEKPFPDQSVLYNSMWLALKIYDYLGQAASKRFLPVFLLPYLNVFNKYLEVDVEDDSDDDVSDATSPFHSQFARIKVVCDVVRRLNKL